MVVFENPDGLGNEPRELVATRALDEIGKALREQGLMLEDMIEQGREIRGQLLQELYGIDDGDSPDVRPQ